MRRNKRRVCVVLLVTAVLLVLSGCSKLAEIELPPLPTPTAKPTPTPKPSYVPLVTPSAEPEPTSTPTPTPEPTPTPTPEPTPTPAPTPEPNPAGLAVDDATLPEDMLEHNVATLRGTVSVKGGWISTVYGAILTSGGKVVEESVYYPDTMTFSLAGSVNADLHFAQLGPGDYVYCLKAEVSFRDGSSYARELISHPFKIYAEYNAGQLSKYVRSGLYSARYTQEDSVEGRVWNYFVSKLGNPYGAAAVLANMYVESLCTPQRVSGDLSADAASSIAYTQNVDDGFITRSSFVHDGNGYGLCQWQSERKGALYDFAIERFKSVGDDSLQCEFLMLDLESGYEALLEYLKGATDPRAAAREFCYVYEQASESGSRADFADAYLERFATAH